MSDQTQEKFALLCDLGTIVVPKDYDHATALASFKEQNRDKFYYYNDDINDANFPNPSRILKAGDRLMVHAYHQIVSGLTTSAERMAFLSLLQGNVYPGAQGASLVFEQKRAELLRRKWYASFDEADHLWLNAAGRHRGPHVRVDLVGDFEFELGNLDGPWDQENAFLGFCDESLIA